MSRYAFVVSACSKYVPELAALLNSLEFIGNRHDVHVLGYELPFDFCVQFGKLGFRVMYHGIPEAEAREFGGEGEILCRKRYWYAATWGQEYDAVCLLDADMFFVRPVDQFFLIAERAGLIVGAGLEQKRVYGAHEHQCLRDGTPLLAPARWNDRDICCAPVFADMRRWCHAFKTSWMDFVLGARCPDMECLNLELMKPDVAPWVLPLSNSQFVGTNEKLLKPYIRVIRHDQDPGPGSQLWTETGDALYIVHGQFYKARWRRQQLLNRAGCIKGYLGGTDTPEDTNSYRMAAGSMELLYRTFSSMLEGPIQVPRVAYTPSGHPDDSEVPEGSWKPGSWAREWPAGPVDPLDGKRAWQWYEGPVEAAGAQKTGVSS